MQERELQDGTLLYDKETGSIYTLNLSASFFLAHCTGDYSLEQIAREFSLAVGIPLEEALRDVNSTTAILQDKGILESEQ